MRRTFLVALAAIALAPVAEARTWTSKTGQTMEGDFVRLLDGKVEIRSQSTGKVIPVPIGGLSDADQAFLQNLQREVEKQTNPAADPAGDASLEDRFSEAIRQSPTSPGVYYQRGMSRLNGKEYEGAIADFNKAIELDPKYALAYDGRGQAQAESGAADAAHNDFTKAIEIDAELASAYRHRGDNLNDYAKTEEGKEYVYKGTENFRKKLAAAESRNIRSTAWQPLHSTKNLNPRLGMVPVLARADYDMARELEAKYGYNRGGYGGYGGGGPGYGGGPGIGPGVGPGIGPGGPALPLVVYPEKVVKGQTITLTANTDELVKGMPQALGAGGKPNSAFNGRRQAKTAESIKSVDFYRDANGNGTFEEDGDQLLATDSNGEDGYSVEVSTAALPAGKQSFYALPRGDETPNRDMLAAADKLVKAAQAERRVAERAETGAAGEGLTAEAAGSLGRTQDSVAKTADEVCEECLANAPEVAELLKQAKTPIGAADEQIGQAEANPGEASKAPAKSAAEQAEEAAEKLEEAAAKLREAAAEPGNGEPATGKPVQGQGEITPGEAPGPGPGPGGPGSGPGPGGEDNKSNDDDDRDIIVNVDIDNEDDDRDGVDVNVGDDDDHGDVVVNVDVDDTIDRALGYIDDGDYDNAVVEYDRLIEQEPDRDYYYRSRGDTYLAAGRYDYAIRDYDRLVEVGGVMTADLYYNRGCAYLAARQYEKAIADFSSSIELDETGSLAWNNRGSTYARLGDFAKAIDDFTHAIAINADDIVAYRNRALAYKKLGEAAKATADLDQVKRIESL
ncbi:MAG: tetratricopeptide repeat protein [Planctomycetales bacterium]|nr:tetratricopeptide repeat protein [Planctomycetales bacterium]